MSDLQILESNFKTIFSLELSDHEKTALLLAAFDIYLAKYNDFLEKEERGRNIEEMDG